MIQTAPASGLLCDRALLDQKLEPLLPNDSSLVARAMRYAMIGPGQRLRPILALRVARTLCVPEQIALRNAAAVEMLHCASLIVDDLPCMDNDAVRRNRPSVHIEFGEATAILAAFALVALAARIAADHSRFQQKLLGTLDCNSLIGGQALDLELVGERRDRQRSSVTALKTVPLFLLAVEAGSVSTSAPLAEKRALLAFGREFGIAYQLVDDYLDLEIADLDQVTDQFDRARDCLLPLGERAPQLAEMLDYLHAKILI